MRNILQQMCCGAKPSEIECEFAHSEGSNLACRINGVAMQFQAGSPVLGACFQHQAACLHEGSSRLSLVFWLRCALQHTAMSSTIQTCQHAPAQFSIGALRVRLASIKACLDAGSSRL